MCPLEADLLSNRNRVINALTIYWHKAEIKRRAPKFKIGDVVRVKRSKNIFSRGYDRIFTRESYKIHKVYTHMPLPMYEITDYYGDEIIKGLWYAEELQAYKAKTFRITKVIKTRRNKDGISESYVQWDGYRKPTWILTRNIADRD
jgi:hypothetical protein